ncbi:MAG: hypothetical protein QM296_03565 [Bacillota bacterium]|nr:hypothetical protein [Bacillota bacterium]
MTTATTHYSALRYWNVPLAHRYFAKEIEQAGAKQLTAYGSPEELRRIRSPVSQCTQPLPPRSLIRTSDGVFVSLEMLYVQLAATLDIWQTIILGDLLCAFPAGVYSRPQVTPRQLREYARQAKGMYGRRQALRALQYVKPNANSCQEVFVDLFIALPHALGGLGIKGGCFNHEVILTDAEAAAMRADRFYIDYCFPDAKIAYEYQGRHHDNTTDRDTRRNLALSRLGYQLVPVTRSILYVPNQLSLFLQQVTNIHRIRLQIRCDQYERGLHRIHELLPRHL